MKIKYERSLSDKDMRTQFIDTKRFYAEFDLADDLTETELVTQSRAAARKAKIAVALFITEMEPKR